LALFLLIGFTDLVATAVLHSKGLITEVNPLMAYFIDKGEWLFAIVKGATLVGGWIALASYAKTNLAFVRNVSYAGSAAYLGLWLGLFAIYR
jgi:uncharacterized membrane protein